MTVSETVDSMAAGLDMLLAAVRADDPKRETLVRVGDLMRDVNSLTAALSDQVVVPRPLDEWHEDMGAMLWWKFPVEEAPWCGTPNDLGHEVLVEMHISTSESENKDDPSGTHRFNVGGWPGYHTHFTPIPSPASPAVEVGE